MTTPTRRRARPVLRHRRFRLARARDRRVYLAGHPVLFALLAATRRGPAVRIGGTVLVHDRRAFVTALTRIRLDRTAEGTTGGTAGRLTGTGMLFDQQGDAHRRTRRRTADALGVAGVARLRPLWTDQMDRALAPLAGGGEVDLVALAATVSGTTAAALLGLDVDGRALAEAARAAGAAAARAHLPGLTRLIGPARRRAERAATSAAADLATLIAAPGDPKPGLSTMLAVAAVTTTVAALPRAAAWAADSDLWEFARRDPEALADELLRVTAPTPLLPRVAAESGDLCPAHTARTQVAAGSSPAGTCPVRAGDRLLLVARHAVAAHRTDPDPVHPAPAHIARLVFGTGPHTCPGARLARAQTADLLTALAPYRPVVVRARADRHAALPSWRSLIIRAAANRSAGAPLPSPATTWHRRPTEHPGSRPRPPSASGAAAGGPAS